MAVCSVLFAAAAICHRTNRFARLAGTGEVPVTAVLVSVWHAHRTCSISNRVIEQLYYKEAAMKNIFAACLFFMCGFAFAQSELGYLYFKYEVTDKPWTGYVPPNADNLGHIVCLDITFISNLPKEYTDYFVDVFENTENNTGVTNPFGTGRKAFAIFTRTGNGFISRRPFAKKWDDTMLVGPGNYGQGYTEAEMRKMITSYVHFVLNTGGNRRKSYPRKWRARSCVTFGKGRYLCRE